MGHATSIHQESWPLYDATIIAQAEVTIAVQVNGKMRGTFTAPPDASQETIIAFARAVPGVAVHMEGKSVVREVVVPQRLVNFVVK
jgi:leucyl-tRNA synthetase